MLTSLHFNVVENLLKLKWNFSADIGGETLKKEEPETEQNRLFVATDAYGAARVEGYDWHKTQLGGRSYRPDIRRDRVVRYLYLHLVLYFWFVFV